MQSVLRRAGLGVLAAAVGLAVAELAAGVLPGGRSPVVSVADRIIALAPGALVREAVEALGAADKPVLVVAVLLAVAAAGGAAALVRPTAGLLVAAALGAAGAWAAVGLPDATAVAAVPPLAGAAAGAAALRWLTSPGAPEAPLDPAARQRRTLVLGGTGALAAVVALGGRALQGRVDAEAIRRTVVLPPPSSPLPPVPPGTSAYVDGVAPYITPNDRFYRIDTALLVPQVDVAGWSLQVHGMVDEPFVITYDELIALPLVESDLTLTCVSNEVGGDLVGNARWLGVPVRELLDRAGVARRADQLVGRSVDGFTAGMPLADVLDGRDALVAVGMNGEPLPVRHGFPARLVVAGLYGYVSATKWLASLEVTRFDAFDPYWVRRGWARHGPIKPQTRIDVARPGIIAGVAWAQADGGVEAVEVQVDEGPWQPAVLADTTGSDTWRQWRLDWPDAEPGDHVVRARCVPTAGAVQTGEVAPPFPDGASGWHRVGVSV